MTFQEENKLASHRIPESTLRDYYKILNSSIDEYERRKQTINSFFLTLNSILITGFGFITANFQGGKEYHWGIFSLSLIGILSIFEWKKLIDHLNSHIKIKNELVTTLEEQLPVEIFRSETLLISHAKKKRNKHFFLESKIPLTFLFLYLFYFYTIFFKPLDSLFKLYSK